MRLDLCDYCNKVYEVIRADKAVCDNNCASKLIASRKLGRQTPREIYEQMFGSGGEINSYKIEHEIIKPKELLISDIDLSEKHLREAQQQLKNYKP